MSETRFPRYADDQFVLYKEKLQQAEELKKTAAAKIAEKLTSQPMEGIRILRAALEQAEAKFIKGESGVDQVLTLGLLAVTNSVKASKRMPDVSQLSESNYLYALLYASRSQSGATKPSSFKSLVFYYLYDACLPERREKNRFQELYAYGVIEIDAIIKQLIDTLKEKNLIQDDIEEKLANKMIELISGTEGFEVVKKAIEEGGKLYEALGGLSFIKSWGRVPDTKYMTKQDYVTVLQQLLTDSGKLNNTSLKGFVLKKLIDACELEAGDKKLVDDLFKCGLLHLKTINDKVCKVIETARLIDRREKEKTSGTELKDILQTRQNINGKF